MITNKIVSLFLLFSQYITTNVIINAIFIICDFMIHVFKKEKPNVKKYNDLIYEFMNNNQL